MAPTAIINFHDHIGYSPGFAAVRRSLQPYGHYRKSKQNGSGSGALCSKILCSTTRIDNDPAVRSPYFWQLSIEEINEIEAGVHYFQGCRLHSGLSLSLFAINKKTFPLSDRFRSKLDAVLEALYHGHQFLILCGLEPHRYGNVENVIIHVGISCHIGEQRGLAGREGGDNTAVHHIIAMIASPRGSTGQYHGPPNQAREIPFHTDNGDIVSLYALSTSLSGGTFYLADSTAVYNELEELAPRFARCLRDDWTMVSVSPTKRFDSRPVAFPHHPSGRTLINCSRSRITGTPSRPRPTSLPPLTKIQKQALDFLHDLAAKRSIHIRLQPGDMIFFNNLSMMHARDAFVDDDAMGQKRHLLRLILRNEEMAHELPKPLEETWKALYEHNVEEELFPVKEELFTFASTH